jgi:hypothetical protein
MKPFDWRELLIRLGFALAGALAEFMRAIIGGA